MQYPSHKELKKCTQEQLQKICAALREDIIASVSENGGHLASSLGAVELCVVLHKYFDLNGNDAVFFDVGHQAYAHKLLTGRENSFKRLRQFDGCSGFTSPAESSTDPVCTGHAGVSISQAAGAAKALDMLDTPGKIVAVIGDGALGCGIAWEALNNIRDKNGRLLIILNDNQMSISPNRGSIRKCLNKIISGRFYNRIRSSISAQEKNKKNIFLRLLRRIEHSIKGIFFSDGILFQELGFRYFGPIDGNNIKELCSIMQALPSGKPVILHVVTQKGCGYTPAEKNPEIFHGVSPFCRETGTIHASSGKTYSDAFSEALCALAEEHGDVAAISAAMCSGTGLAEFEKKFPERCFDEGIAEGHSVAFASGLACRGMRPVVAMYSTFLQRALDNVYHDICLNNLPVIFCIDRTGAVPDGPTHHGIYALPFLKQLPNLTIMSPADRNEMKEMLYLAYSLASPVILRYPRGKYPELPGTTTPVECGKSTVICDPENADLSIWASGAELARALKVAALLEKHRIKARIVNARFILPFDNELAKKLSSKPQVVMDDYTPDGLYASLKNALSEIADAAPLLPFTWPANTILRHGNIEELRKKYNLTEEKIAQHILAAL